MIPVHVAITDDTHSLDPAILSELAGALNEQIQHDFAPVWHVQATVGIYAIPPAGTWAIRIRKQLDQPGALGYHTDQHNQPVSYVELTADYTITVSHELLEMLADPYGSRMHPARLPDGLETHHQDFGLPYASSRVHYLLEVCDPCEARSYQAGGIDLSDFLHPAWYRTNPQLQSAYSHAGGCVRPRQVAAGGYVSFATPDGNWWQAFNQNSRLQIQKLGRYSRDGAGSLREWTDRHARQRQAM